jgi:RNase P/RNase MRP subunit POP5
VTEERAQRVGAPSPDGPLTFDDWESPPIPEGELAELFMALDKAARALRLYNPNNPVYQSFSANLASAFRRLWDRVPALQAQVEEAAFRCFGRSYAAGEGRESLPFAFYKDGIRVLTFLPGFEEEAERFLRVVNHARQVDQRATDDMVTLLWEEEFTTFQYSYVDALAEGLSVPEAAGFASGSLNMLSLREDVSAPAAAEQSPAVRAGKPTVVSSVTAADFEETLYFLEPNELERLQAEVDLEWTRDVKGAVLDALFDRLEDATAERRLEILRILRQLVTAYLGRGDLVAATQILVEINGLISTAQVGENEMKEALELFNELNDPKVLGQLLRALEDGSIDPSSEELGVFLSHLNAEALPVLIRQTETTDSSAVRQRLRVSIEGLGRQHARALAGLIDTNDDVIARGAARLAGQLGLADAAPKVVTLYRRSDLAGRRVAMEALIQMRTSVALAAAQEALGDEDREVRITAARGIGTLRYQPARARLEQLLDGKELRESDLTEQIAFFEAFAAVAGADGVKTLDKLLNGRRLLGRQSPEVRSCAAMALGRIATRDARTALEQSASDPHPMVRSAVARALAGEPTVR